MMMMMMMMIAMLMTETMMMPTLGISLFTSSASSQNSQKVVQGCPNQVSRVCQTLPTRWLWCRQPQLTSLGPYSCDSTEQITLSQFLNLKPSQVHKLFLFEV